MPTVSRPPRVTIGLPVYNGENYLAESLDALLGQSYEDFELVISDNASTDATAEICRHYEKRDSRIRFFRQPSNVGLAKNHHFVLKQGRGELFKWVSHDDLYARDLLERCVTALDKYPHVVLAHSWTATIDSAGNITKAVEYPLSTASSRAPLRFRSMLFDTGSDDGYGVVRAEVLRRIAPHNSYHHADRTLPTEIGLYGPFYQVPDWLYFRRDHPAQAERACHTTRARCANMDPRRANTLRHPVVRLYGEYIYSYIAAIYRAPLSASDRRECYRYLGEWMASRAVRRDGQEPLVRADPARPVPSVDSVVAGRERRAS